MSFKSEYPILFKTMQKEVYDDIEITDLGIDSRNDELIIYLKKGNRINQGKLCTPIDELNGWVFDNNVVLNLNYPWDTEKALAKEEEKI